MDQLQLVLQGLDQLEIHLLIIQDLLIDLTGVLILLEDHQVHGHLEIAKADLQVEAVFLLDQIANHHRAQVLDHPVVAQVAVLQDLLQVVVVPGVVVQEVVPEVVVEVIKDF